MRFRHPDGTTVHLAYCSNVHAAEDLDGVVAQLGRFAGPVRRALGSQRVGVGLWLAAAVAHHLAADHGATDRLRTALDAHGVEVVTLNGFPYRAFHAPVVKGAVYLPDWRDPERGAYTADLARVLARLLPEDVTVGSISTLPLGWRTGWDHRATAAACDALGRLADELTALEARSGKRVRVGIEPEPGCVVETVAQAADALQGLDHDRLGVCLDACHLAVQFEDAQAALDLLDEAGIAVVKAQVSAALTVPAPRSDDGGALLRDFVEPRFLHQAREVVRGAVAGCDDLDEALDGGLPGDAEWRVHYHLPVHSTAATTQPQLRRTLAALMGGAPATPHLEVETYTWNVLPPERRPRDDAGLVAGLAAELDWTRAELVSLGLTTPDRHPLTTPDHHPDRPEDRS